MADRELVPLDQKEVSFYGDELTAVRADDNKIYVVLAHLCDALGVDTQAQARRINRHKVLANGYQRVAILTTHRGRQKAGSLRVDLVPLWLAGIRTSMVDETIRPKLERFQGEAASVLWEAFQAGRLTADPSFKALLEADSPTAQAYKMARAVMNLAQQQLVHEARIDDHELRLAQIEGTLGDPGRNVTPEQASQISQGVKAVAIELSRQSGRNEYGGIYGELYRKFGITSYKLLPASKFQDAMSWLSEWYSSLTDKAVPF
jgi:hypothetical protein